MMLQPAPAAVQRRARPMLGKDGPHAAFGHDTIFAQDVQPLHNVNELADIAGPAIAAQALKRARFDLFHMKIPVPNLLSDQIRNVLRSLSQRRQ